MIWRSQPRGREGREPVRCGGPCRMVRHLLPFAGKKVDRTGARGLTPPTREEVERPRPGPPT
jgi:hypothetical protein